MANPNGSDPAKNGVPVTTVGTPWFMEKASITPGEPEPVTYRTAPEGDKSILIAFIPIGNELPTCDRVPLVELMENTEISNDPELATYRNAPAASMARSVGAVPTTVRGVTSVSPPVLEMSYNDTSPSPEFAAYKNFPDGWTTSDCTAGPATMGLPASWVSTPEFGSSR